MLEIIVVFVIVVLNNIISFVDYFLCIIQIVCDSNDDD